ncbi:MAG TPA: trimethylamine methyltransferase family protein [Acidimicrobiia bacterium]|nr:trimethylamine methyltransferase family protein [Acidimicrobiia bacterium]
MDSAAPPARRRSRRERRPSSPGATTRYRNLTNPFQPAEVLSADQVESIHAAALTLLADIGIRVLLPEARSILADAGAIVDETEEMVRFDPGLVEESLRSAPSSFRIVSRWGERDVTLGDTSVVFVPVSGPPFATDLDRGRRAGTLDDFEDFLKLFQSYDIIHSLGPAVEPQDIPLEARHLRMTLSQIQLSDKVPFVYSRGRAQVADCLEMVRIAAGVDEETFVTQPRAWSVINTNSPRQIDLPMGEGLIDFARAGQVLVITPFTLAGAMAPVSLAGALTLQHAEALAGITLAQVVRSGSPVVYGAFTSNVDMRSGAPAFGTPEAYKAAIASGQLARHIGVPWRSSGVNTSNVPDAQSAYETMMNTFGALQGGAHMIIHAAGWLESGLSASFEKLVLDVDVLQMVAESWQPIDTSDTEIALDAIAGVDPGGHFFGTAHTLERYRSAFYEPLLFDRSNHEQWKEAGSPQAMERANQLWKQVLAAYEPPPLDAAIAAELADFVDRRIAEGGALPRS